jgi:hypothetical protein
MKHLREFDDQEIQDLMGDLEKVGHERLKGWYIGTINEDGYFGICAVLAHNEGELEQIMRESWRWAKQYMPERIGDAYKGRNTLYNNFLDALMSNLMDNEVIKFSQVFKDLAVKNSAGKKPSLLTFPGYNPIIATEKLEELFSNIRQKMLEEKEYFEEESGVKEFPNLKR